MFQTRLQNNAESRSRGAQELELIPYRGWRTKIVSKFLDVLEIEAVTSRDKPFLIFNTIFFGVIAI
ncbi:DUF1523 family protein [Pseudomonas syringae]|uniref:DUF1523 family protein n=1 Tax=Pseudomonas syringae UB303 TaxID=1357287 RepID=A0AAJ4B470_PSESX|nr:DUF1523 family protein [Pseudomonas syringae]MDY2565317.1 DUF1523 family protein [Pseudomonas syringae]QHF06650.1 DUF1523 family protein [Pseudomonas syringae UB303]